MIGMIAPILAQGKWRTLSEKTGNGCSRKLCPSCWKLPENCCCWNGLETRGCSPCRNELKICKSPVLANPDKTQKPYQKWSASENHQRNPPQGITLPLQGSAQMPNENSWNSATNSSGILLLAKTGPLLRISIETPAENPALEHLQVELRPFSQGLRSHKRSPAP